jgi:hypothetical protein
MAEKTFASLRDWVEPAHPGVVQLLDDLVSIYTVIRDQYQAQVDEAFDRVSKQIGFVVTTTIPVVFEIAEGGRLKNINMGAEHLKDTLFHRELPAVFKASPQPQPWKVAPGNYQLYLLWRSALRLKLGTAWLEPAHPTVSRFGAAQVEAERVRPEVMEPAHWFDSGVAIAVNDRLLIEAIDTVYPELRLAERVAFTRRLVRPEVQEPAHPPQFRKE